jgi:hypothetical protein
LDIFVAAVDTAVVKELTALKLGVVKLTDEVAVSVEYAPTPLPTDVRPFVTLAER